MEMEFLSESDVSETVRALQFRAANGNTLQHGFSTESPHANAPELWSALPEDVEFDVIYSSGVHTEKSVAQELEALLLGKRLKRVRFLE
jgi:hypothetical protein